MQLDPKTIKKHFQKSIDKYAENALVQRLMAEKLAAAIPERTYENVLEIGTGAGLLTEKLAKLDCKTFYANDLVDKSEVYVKNFVPSANFFGGDFRRIKFNRKFDLITSNAVFQWFDDAEKVFARCSDYLTQDGLLAFSTFSPENFSEFREVCGLSLDYKSEAELRLFLGRNFEIISFEKFEYKMKFDNPLQILTHMKNTGVNSLSAKTWGIKEVKEFCDNYKAKFPDLTLTYSPMIVIAKLLVYS